MRSDSNGQFLCIISSSLAAIILTTILFPKTSASSEKIKKLYSNPSTEKFLTVSGNRVSIILTGDVMLGRTVMKKSKELGDFSYPFRKVGQTLRDADIVFINLENPIIKSCPEDESGFKFCTNPEMVEGLILAGVDVVNLANNHSRNYSEEGLLETKEILEKNAILVTGLNNLTIKQYNNTFFGFLGFDFTTREPKTADFDLIRKSDSLVDVLIVGVHWGIEYTDEPLEVQRTWARKMVEAGADVVSGHHPHWIQGSEFINGKPVYYSLGNFVFDQMWSEKTKEGLAIRLTFERDKIIKEERLPIYMKNWAQPQFTPADD